MSLVKVFFMALIIVSLGCDTGKVYRKPMARSIQTLDPKKTRERSDYMIARNIYGQFVAYDTYGNIQPGIFKDWTISEGGKVYTFTLDPNVRFHDGKTLGMDDVLFSLHYLAAKDSLMSMYFSNIEGYDDFIRGTTSELTGIKAIGSSRLEIRLKSRSYIFLSQLADPKMVLLPARLRGMSEEDFFKHPIGAGSYQVKSLDGGHNRLILERFEGYHGRKSNIKIYELEVMDKAKAITLFLDGRLEDLESYRINNEEELESLKSKANLFSPSPSSMHILLFNGRKKYLQDRNVRKAIAEAIDISNLSYETCHRYIPTNSIIPHGLLGWRDQNKAVLSKNMRRADPSLSKKCQLRILNYNFNIAEGVIECVAKSISEKTEFSVNIDTSNASEALKVFLAGDYDILLESITVKLPEPFYIFTYFDPRSTHNLIFFEDANIPKMLTEAEGLLGVQRSNKYIELSRYISQDQYYAIPLYTVIDVYAFGKTVTAEGSPATLYGNTFFEQVKL